MRPQTLGCTRQYCRGSEEPPAALRAAVPAEAGVPSRACHQAGEKPSRVFRRFPRPFYSLAVQPAAGRSNQTWTCPVPTAFSYSENSRPGAVQPAPPAAATAIR